ncbi:MAG: von Willebrand factor type domain protein [Phycisphaerales bacterium]|nr:von Willebrand factor type domain protein [Phycisphaerales bacterium]
MTIPSPILAFTSPIRLEFMSWWSAALLFAGLGAIVVLLGMRSLNGLGAVRKWVAIGVRLAVLLLLVLILAGVRWQRKHTALEVWVLRDVSPSTDLVEKKDYTGKSLQDSIDDYLRESVKDKRKQSDDRVGIISFTQRSQVDTMPSKDLKLDTRGIPERGSGTDASSAIQLALASMSPDAMHRLVLISDGNYNAGDLDAALGIAKSQNVPIDVMPLHYDVQNAVMIERFVSPTWKRENEPFSIDVILQSTGSRPIPGKLEVLHKTEGGNEVLEKARPVTLEPGLHVEHVRVPALQRAGVHQFVAKFTPDPGALQAAGGAVSANIDKINQPAESFVFVKGKGQVLYVDNYRDGSGQRGPGEFLAKALAGEEISLRTITMDQFPQNLVALQNYDAVILGNVRHGEGGITTEQDKMLATYVHDMGGGLIMLGGEDSFGAGGWQGSEIEKILPVDMDIPAQRQVGKGALVLVMHSCEMPDGNFWGLQCALQSVKTLSEHDEVGIISYNWGGGGGANGIGGASWDFVLQEKGDGSAVTAAAKKMQLGDMPSFDDSLNLAMNGANGGYCLSKSNARHKHVIIISDGDPQAPNPTLVQQYKQNKVSVSTVTVFPHQFGQSGLPPTMEDIAKQLGGHAYGPINKNPNQLPQIFIKEATIVRRSLIKEDEKGIAVNRLDASDEMVRGMARPPAVFGMVLTSKKSDPKVSMPFAAGTMNDPLLAHWQAGLGKAAVFTSDPTAKWGVNWVGSPDYAKFWAQVVRSVSRPPMSGDFDVQTTTTGTKGKITVEALGKDDTFQNFLNIGGNIIGPDGKHVPVRLVQTGPGTYEAEFDAREAGNYVVALNYSGQKQSGMLLSGVAMNSDPEMRDLKSNEAKLEEIRDRTGGRMLPAWDAGGADLFTREGLVVTASPMPIWDWLIPVLLGLILLDVAARRIAWDWQSTKRMALAMGDRIRAYTTVRRVESRTTLDAFRRVREEVAETKFRPAETGASPPPVPSQAGARPDPRAKFEAKAGGVEGNITQIVGGATDKPVPPPPKKIEPKGAPSGGSHTGSLLEAKRRAQQQIKKKESE